MAIIPEFKHKISATVQSKLEVAGIYDDIDSELVYDDEMGVVLRKIGTVQMSIFDDDVYNSSAENAEPEQQPQLSGGVEEPEQQLQLSGEMGQEPIEDADFIEAQYREADGEGYAPGDYYHEDDGYRYDEA